MSNNAIIITSEKIGKIGRCIHRLLSFNDVKAFAVDALVLILMLMVRGQGRGVLEVKRAKLMFPSNLSMTHNASTMLSKFYT